jgi:hypothetical protein
MQGELARMWKQVGKPQEAAPESDSERLTLEDMNGDYSTMRPANKPLLRLHIRKKDGTVRTLFYHHIDAEGSFEGDSFTLLFCGAKHWELTVKGHGEEMWRIYDYISLNRWPYLLEATDHEAQFADKGKTVLTEISVQEVTPRFDR